MDQRAPPFRGRRGWFARLEGLRVRIYWTITVAVVVLTLLPLVALIVTVYVPG